MNTETRRHAWVRRVSLSAFISAFSVKFVPVISVVVKGGVLVPQFAALP